MAKIYISELINKGSAESGVGVEVAVVPPLVEQTVAVAGASAQSAAFNARTKFVRVATDTAVNLAFGLNPTATTSKLYMPAGSVEYFAVSGGMKVAAIQGV